MTDVKPRGERRGLASRPLLEGLAGYVLFAGVGFLARYVPLAFHLMGVIGFVIPLAWGKHTSRWSEMGFTRRNWRPALAWGMGVGLVTICIGVATLRSPGLTHDLGHQMVIGVPFALLLASPFQEFFFRGWLQTRCEAGLGGRGGLWVSNVVFLLWHYLTPFSSAPGFAYPLHTVMGLLGTLLAGLLYGFAFQRTRSILAPWLAHGLAHVAFAAVGAVVFADVFSGLAGG